MKIIVIDDETNSIIDNGTCGCDLTAWDTNNPIHTEIFKDIKKIWVKKFG